MISKYLMFSLLIFYALCFIKSNTASTTNTVYSTHVFPIKDQKKMEEAENYIKRLIEEKSKTGKLVPTETTRANLSIPTEDGEIEHISRIKAWIKDKFNEDNDQVNINT